MTLHAQSGGDIEIMGMLTGKVVQNGIVVMDVYPLPVEGTETRVNAQAEGYEFMVQYLDSLRKAGRYENIVGWYHSHPGYGCWLSGIDVGTQALNQQFQDPYLAIVIDPIRTITQGKVDIGAFRTYSEDHLRTNIATTTTTTTAQSFGSAGTPGSPAVTRKNMKRKDNKISQIPQEKVKDFGMHSSKYYSLSVNIFRSNIDHMILSNLWNKYWITSLVGTTDTEQQGQRFEEFLNLKLETMERKIVALKRPSLATTEQLYPQRQPSARRVLQMPNATSFRDLSQTPTPRDGFGASTQLSPFTRANWLAKMKERELDTDESDMDIDVDSDSESRNEDEITDHKMKPVISIKTQWGVSQTQQQTENAKRKEQNDQVCAMAAEASRKLMNLKVQKLVFLNE